MAIQISDKLLSEKAKKALNNAVSKSQFLRDAIEFYVNSMDATNTDNFSIQGTLMKEIEQLKDMINLLGTNKLNIESSEIKNISKDNLVNMESQEEDIKRGEDVVRVKEENQEPIMSKVAVTSNKDIDKKDDELDEIPLCFRDM